MNHPISAIPSSSTPSRRPPAAGFSLIEALIAAALFAIITMGVLPIFVKSTRDVARNRNVMHYNAGMQAVMDELVVKAVISTQPTPPAMPMLSAGWHVYDNATAFPTGATRNTVPQAVFELFDLTNKIYQNQQLGQLQYRVSTEFSKTRVDMRLYYFISAAFVKPMTSICSGSNGACDDTYPAVGSAPIAPPPPPAHMAVISMSNYIN